MDTFRKGTGYRINTQSQQAFLYAENKDLEEEILERVPFANSLKNT